MFHVFSGELPYVGEYAPFAGLALSLTFAYANKNYAPAYAESVEGRMGPFKLRSLAFRGLFYTTAASMLFVGGRMIMDKVN